MDQPVQAPRPLALAAVAVAAALLYQFLLLFPLALMFGLPALWFGSSYLLWASALGFLVMAWVAQPASGSPPQALARADAPDLYRVVDGIADRLNAPRPHAIALDDALNAGALELNRGLSLRPTRRVLVLGRPLLALLDPDALAAVVAHEFGHFSRHHGRLGHWLYRTRLAWMDYVEAANEPDLSAWERAGAAFGQRFVPWFAKASFAHARRNEYEADALAAQACGAAALARALQQIHVLAARWEPTREALRIDMQRQHAEPPADWLPQLAQRLREAASAETTEPERRSDDADPHATHPSLAARLQALSATPQPMGWPAAEACAGAAWLGPRWPAEAIDSRWASAAARHAWRCGHVLLQHGDGLHDPGPEALRHRQALALLADGGDAAAARALLQSLLETAPSWAVPVRTTLAAHAQSLGLSHAERSENLALLQRALERREAAAGLMREARQRGEFTPPPLSAAARTALAQALAAHPVLQAAWCLGLAARLDERRSYRGIALVLRAEPQRLEADALSAEQLADSAAELLAPLCDADTVVMVPLRYTTESVPEELAARPEMLLFSR
jgi:Zn-dependent protease with chaperone function